MKRLLFALFFMLSAFPAWSQQQGSDSIENLSRDQAMARCMRQYEAGLAEDPSGQPNVTQAWLHRDLACIERPDLGWVDGQGRHYAVLETDAFWLYCVDWDTMCPHYDPFYVNNNWVIYIYRSDLVGIVPAQLGPAQCGTAFGNPINAANGNKFEHTVDIQSPSGLLNFERFYNSSTKVIGDTLGKGWRHSYSTRLYAIDATHIDLIEASGRRIQFSENASNWVGDIPESGALTPHVFPDSTLGWKHVEHEGEAARYFNSSGYLVQIDRRGRVVNLAYIQDGQGRTLLNTATDPHGRSLQFSYDNDGRLSSVTASGGETATFTYSLSSYHDHGSLLASTTYSDSKGYKYRYEEERLTGIDDQNDNPLSIFGYDEGGMAVSTQKAGGLEKYTFVHDIPNSLTYVLLNGQDYNRIRFNTSTGTKQPTFWLNPACGGKSDIQNQYYDSNGQVERAQTFSGYNTEYTYNAQHLEIRRTEEIFNGDRAFETDWDTTLRLPIERRTYNGFSTLYSKEILTYNSRGQVLTSSLVDPATLASRTTSTTYCESADVVNGACPLVGLVRSVNGPRTDIADTTTYLYYPADAAGCSSPLTCTYRKGDLWKTTDAAGGVEEIFAYDGAGRVSSYKDINGVVTDYSYDLRGRNTAVKVRGPNLSTETDDRITLMEYWPNGLLKKLTHPDGSISSFTYDAANRLTDIADGANNTIHYTLDRFGNRTAEQVKDAGGTLRRTLTRVFDQLGQLEKIKDAYNVTTTYEQVNGALSKVTDALGRIVDVDYDAAGRLSEVIQDATFGGVKATSIYRYNPFDLVSQVIDPKGRSTLYQYNGLGDRTQLTSPDTGATTYTFDSAGNLKTETDARGITATYSYDSLNRPTGITYPTSSLNVTYIYDSVNTACSAGETFAIGRLTQMTDGSGTTQYCYDRFGNLTRKRQTTNGQTLELRYAYTLASQLQAMTYPDGTVIDYVRDSQGRTTEVGVTRIGNTRAVLLNQATYYPFGPIAGWTYGNSRTMTRSVNLNYQPLAISDTGAGGLSLGFEFDAVGNLKKLFNADKSITKAQYGYDALNRLTQVKDGPTGTTIDEYTYDATGNRKSFANAGNTTYYDYPIANHRLTQIGPTARTYDGAGNTTQIGVMAKEFVYNDTNRMSQVKVGGTAVMNYVINGRGEQVRRYVGANNTYTLYDESGRWIGDYDGTGSPVQQAIWLADLPVGLLAGASTNQKLHYIEPDHLGTPRAVIDTAANAAIWRWDLEGDAFGGTVPNQDPDSNGVGFTLNMRFPGQRYDSATGAHYNLFRDYDPVSGRYLQSDPIGLSGGLSTYGYVSANPLKATDPRGLVEWEGRQSGGTFLTGGATKFTLKTKECYKGERTIVDVWFVGAGLGVGAEGSITVQKASLVDDLLEPMPSIFDGDGFIAGFDVPIPQRNRPGEELGRVIAGRPKPEWTGGGCGAMRLGGAGGYGCGGFKGFALGIGILYGSSTVTGVRKEACDCDKNGGL